MIYEERVARKHNNKEYIKLITDAAKTISVGGEVVQKSAEAITIACYTPGTKEETNRDMLLDKVGDMKKLVVLYRSASKRLLKFTRDLEEDKPNDKALSDILHYVLFFIGQLKCEEEAAYVVLGKLKER